MTNRSTEEILADLRDCDQRQQEQYTRYMCALNACMVIVYVSLCLAGLSLVLMWK